MNNRAMGIYIHIPFCIKKCNYCDFLSFCGDEELKTSYVNALTEEIKAYGRLYGKNGVNYSASVPTVFFGGGTPSVLDTKYIDRIMAALHDFFDLSHTEEITIECNPGTINAAKLSDYKHLGINRLSIGLQSACSSELKALGRIHTYSDFVRGYNSARNKGFDNINVDIMSAIPGQTILSYKKTLDKVLSLEPEHISAYSLIIEENTPFYNIYENYKPDCGYAPLTDEDTDREMYYMTDELLESFGLKRYEISNYAKKGFECKHNLSYWSRCHYLGFGLGASSFIDNVRFKNVSDIKEYIKICGALSESRHVSVHATASDYNAADYSTSNIAANRYIDALTDKKALVTLTPDDEMAEYMYLGLRKINGVSIREFSDAFGVELSDIYGDVLDKHVKYGLINIKNDTVALTKRGLDISNYILSDFIL